MRLVKNLPVLVEEEEGVEGEELSSFLIQKTNPTGKQLACRTVLPLRRRRPELPWMLSTGVLAILLVLSLFVKVGSRTTDDVGGGGGRSYEVPSTEFPALLPAVEYEIQHYTGLLTYNETLGTAVRVRDADIDFFGPPSDEMDRRWNILLHDEFPAMMEDEVPADLSDISRFPDGYFHFEPDFLHNIHCLNEVRKEVSKILYPGMHQPHQQQQQQQRGSLRLRDGDVEWAVDHIEHCMDRIRQALMCHADLTPSIMHRWEGFSYALGQTGPRKCRKWQPIRQWMDERNAAFSSDKEQVTRSE